MAQLALLPQVRIYIFGRNVTLYGCSSYGDLLNAGVIGDITEPKERGGIYGLYALGSMVKKEFADVLSIRCRSDLRLVQQLGGTLTASDWLIGLEVAVPDKLFCQFPELTTWIALDLSSGSSVSHPLPVF